MATGWMQIQHLQYGNWVVVNTNFKNTTFTIW